MFNFSEAMIAIVSESKILETGIRVRIGRELDDAECIDIKSSPNSH
jgi:hypothetical protein